MSFSSLLPGVPFLYNKYFVTLLKLNFQVSVLKVKYFFLMAYGFYPLHVFTNICIFYTLHWKNMVFVLENLKGTTSVQSNSLIVMIVVVGAI